MLFYLYVWRWVVILITVRLTKMFFYLHCLSVGSLSLARGHHWSSAPSHVASGCLCQACSNRRVWWQPGAAMRPLQRRENPVQKATPLVLDFSLGVVLLFHSSCLAGWRKQSRSSPPAETAVCIKIAASGFGRFGKEGFACPKTSFLQYSPSRYGKSAFSVVF